MPSYSPPQSLLDALYCEEQHWDKVDTLSPFSLIEGGGDSSVPLNANNFLNDLLEDEELGFLLNKERGSELGIDLEENLGLTEARAEAVEWMLRIVGYYSFSALTAVLAVTYFHKFFQSFRTEREKPWMFQLAAVACLSLAAKVEESQVPLLLDLQVEESKHVFDSKTIQRMELLILSTLGWKMNPVTPISFLGYIARKLGWNGGFLRRCECLLLSVISDCRFMNHLPSALATATMLYVISSREPCLGLEYHDMVGILGIDRDKVEDCCELIQEVVTSSRRKRKLGETIPGSPKGVMDLSFSFSSSGSSSNESSWTVSSVSSSPLSKKMRPNNNDDSPKNANS